MKYPSTEKLETIYFAWKDAFEQESKRPVLSFDAFREGFKQGAVVFSGTSDKLIKALEEACKSRYALIVNSDPDDPPTDPITYDTYLQKWTAVLSDASSNIPIPDRRPLDDVLPGICTCGSKAVSGLVAPIADIVCRDCGLSKAKTRHREG
jgi:hypothetical protein